MNLSSFTLYKFKRSSKRWKIFSTIKSMKKLFLFFAKKNVSEKDENSTKSENFNVQSSITLTRKKNRAASFRGLLQRGNFDLRIRGEFSRGQNFPMLWKVVELMMFPRKNSILAFPLITAI